MNCALIYRELSDKEILQVKELYTNGAEVRISPLQPIPNKLSHIKNDHVHTCINRSCSIIFFLFSKIDLTR